MNKEISLTEQNSKSLSLLTFILLALLIDVIFISGNSDVFTFFLLSFYILGSFFFKVKSKRTFFIAFLLCILMYIFFLLQLTEKAEKSAVWLFLFLLTGVTQQLFE